MNRLSGLTAEIQGRMQSARAAAALRHAAYASFVKASGMYVGKSRELICRDLFPNDAIAQSLFLSPEQRAAIIPGDTSTGWAAESSDRVALDFLLDLVPESAAAKLMARGVTIPASLQDQVLMPRRSSGPIDMPWVGEGKPIPLTSDGINGVKLNPTKKVGILIAFTRETAKKAAAPAVFDTVLRESAGRSLDSAYFNANAATANSIAGMLFGATEVTAGVGANAKEDLAALARVVASGNGQVCFVTGGGRAAALSILMPEMKGDIFGSAAVSDNIVIGIDPMSFLHGVGPYPDIEASSEAVLHMEDDPQEIVSGTGPTTAEPVRSLWQTDAVAMRALIDVTWVARRTGAVAFIQNMSW